MISGFYDQTRKMNFQLHLKSSKNSLHFIQKTNSSFMYTVSRKQTAPSGTVSSTASVWPCSSAAAADGYWDVLTLALICRCRASTGLSPMHNCCTSILDSYSKTCQKKYSSLSTTIVSSGTSPSALNRTYTWRGRSDRSHKL